MGGLIFETEDFLDRLTESVTYLNMGLFDGDVIRFRCASKAEAQWMERLAKSLYPDIMFEFKETDNDQ